MIDTSGLTIVQRAKLAYALEVIRSTQTLRGWTLYRLPSVGEPKTLRLLKRDKTGRLLQAWDLCRDEQPH